MAEILQIRASEEVQKKFKEKASELNLSQGETLNTMLLALDMQAGGEKMPTEKGNLDQFQQLANSLTTMYLVALQNSANQKAIAVESIREQLDSKDSQIIQLQKKLEEAKKEAEKSVELQRKLNDDEKIILNLKEQYTAVEKLNHMLTSQLSSQENIESMKAELAELRAAVKAKDEIIEILKIKK